MGTSRLALRATALGVVALAFAASHAGLAALSAAADARTSRWAYDAEEELLRYVLPGYLPPGREWFWVTGPSAAGESFLDEKLEAGFAPLRAFHGTIDMGRLSEVRLLLELFERRHGKQALPRIVLLGVSPRFVSGISHVESEVANTLDRYAIDFGVDRDDGRFELVAKTSRARWLARARRLPKQARGYRIRLLEFLVERVLGRAPYAQLVPDLDWVRDLSSTRFPFRGLEHLARRLRLKGPSHTLRAFVQAQTSAYFVHGRHMRRTQDLESWLDTDPVYWPKTFARDPALDTAAQAELARLAELARTRDVELWVVNLPEHPAVRSRYDPGNYRAYLALLDGAFGRRFIDLGDLSTEMYDLEHPTYEGALTVTRAVLEAVASRREEAS